MLATLKKTNISKPHTQSATWTFWTEKLWKSHKYVAFLTCCCKPCGNWKVVGHERKPDWQVKLMHGRVPEMLVKLSLPTFFKKVLVKIYSKGKTISRWSSEIALKASKKLVISLTLKLQLLLLGNWSSKQRDEASCHLLWSLSLMTIWV